MPFFKGESAVLTILRLGRGLLPILFATIALVLAMHQSAGLAHAAETTIAIAHIAAPDHDCASDTTHLTSCCSTSAGLPANTFTVAFRDYPVPVDPVDPAADASKPNPRSKLFRPPRAA